MKKKIFDICFIDHPNEKKEHSATEHLLSSSAWLMWSAWTILKGLMLYTHLGYVVELIDCWLSWYKALGTKRLASEEFINDWDNKRLNAGEMSNHSLVWSFSRNYCSFICFGVLTSDVRMSFFPKTSDKWSPAFIPGLWANDGSHYWSNTRNAYFISKWELCSSTKFSNARAVTTIDCNADTSWKRVMFALLSILWYYLMVCIKC